MSALDQVETPAGTTGGSEWFDLDDRPWRFIQGVKRTITEGADDQWRAGEISVQAAAVQYSTGRFTDPDEQFHQASENPGVTLVALTDDRLSPDQARRLAAELVAADDEVDGWTKR